MYDDQLNESYIYDTDCEAIDTSYYYHTELKKRQDSFLDSYSYYLKDKTDLHKSVLKRKVIELELIDPTFTFDLD